MKAGIIDTGIDVRHPCFSDAGFPATRQLGDTRYTNNKVIVARVFANKAANQGLAAEAVQDHGTHVAGTVACDLDTPAVVDGVDVPYDVSGVAPAAQLGNYNIFPGEIGNARSEDIVDALESAYADGMDVVNMSLGGGASGAQDVLTVAVDNLDLAGSPATIGATLAYFRTGNDDIMAGFSSQGPADTAARRVKPDVVAPGVNVLSSIPLQFCGTTATTCFAFFQGTSMATPHLAGMAAVVIDSARARGLSLTAEQVRSAVVNTADEGVLKSAQDGTTLVTDVNITGTGRGNLAKAVAGKVAVGPVSTSFGTVPGGSGQTRTATVTLSSLTGTAVTVTPVVDTVLGSGATFSVPAAPVTVPATGSVTVTVSLTVAKGAAAGDRSAMLRLVAGGAEVAHAVLYTYVS